MLASLSLSAQTICTILNNKIKLSSLYARSQPWVWWWNSNNNVFIHPSRSIKKNKWYLDFFFFRLSQNDVKPPLSSVVAMLVHNCNPMFVRAPLSFLKQIFKIQYLSWALYTFKLNTYWNVCTSENTSSLENFFFKLHGYYFNIKVVLQEAKWLHAE